MMEPPPYFESVRREAEQRWNQLEADPVLAGPWRLLFNQVQNPRHVLSELLQNADDAGATEARAVIEDGTFLFEHNGRDFTEDEFRSLCRFGYSNKRALHTIGFRGIGFKSTFSLGPEVYLFTPTLAVRFDQGRFTQPHWSQPHQTLGWTRIEVTISDEHRLGALKKNLKEWLEHPVSLLFFTHIRHLEIEGQEVRWQEHGPGPVQDSEWIQLEGEKKLFLRIRSEEAPFPPEALAEIREERMIQEEDLSTFPPCRVELILGAEGRLYVILPTNVKTNLPFAANAPFLQDPARHGIKSPDTSPTNRWLLQRIGSLAAKAMLAWLKRVTLPHDERAKAYDLLPNVDRDDADLAGRCATIVEEAVEAAITDQPLLLTHTGAVVRHHQAISLPDPVLEVWPAGVASRLFDAEERPPLSQHIRKRHRDKLSRWNLVDVVDRQEVISVLEEEAPPRPETWGRLLALWHYLAPEFTRSSWYRDYAARDVHIVPVEGRDTLMRAGDVVRLGKYQGLENENDLAFLTDYILDPGWLRFLDRLEQQSEPPGDELYHARKLLEYMGLHEDSDRSTVINTVAERFFEQDEPRLQDCVTLARLAARFDVKVEEHFQYVTRSGELHPADGHLYFDRDGTLEDFIPPELRDACLLHDAYLDFHDESLSKEWERWVASGRAGLATTLKVKDKEVRFTTSSKEKVEKIARQRGCNHDLHFKYRLREFLIKDKDFDKAFWAYWEQRAADEPDFWYRLVQHLLRGNKNERDNAKGALLLQVSQQGTEYPLCLLPLTNWALRLQGLPCLPDTWGHYRRPADLMRRTQETRPLERIEPFIPEELDTEGNRWLFDLLGVRTTPSGPDRILDRLRALAEAERPPEQEVDQWYRSLDHLARMGTEEDVAKIRGAFSQEKLILAKDGSWTVSSGVFLATDELRVPGVRVIRDSVKDLSLWRRIGVAEHPTEDLILAWLQQLPAGDLGDDLNRVRPLLKRYHRRIWESCGHWLNLAGQWAPTHTLTHALFPSDVLPRLDHLFPNVRGKIADLSDLLPEDAASPPFADLPSLSTRLEERLAGSLQIQVLPLPAWLKALAEGLRRLHLDDDVHAQRIHRLAERLARSRWCEVPELSVEPYLDGKPAGTPRTAEVAWLDERLYVVPMNQARRARCLPDELARVFDHEGVRKALHYAVDRDEATIHEYLRENFRLAATLPPLPPRKEETPIDLPEPVNVPAELENPKETSDDIPPLLSHAHARRTHRRADHELMTRYAEALGFQQDAEGEHFVHINGSQIRFAQGSVFPWVHFGPDATILHRYLPIDHCLEDRPLELEKEAWDLLEEKPDLYTLILRTSDGKPIAIKGTHLQALKNQGRLHLYPARYRLVLNK